MNNYFRFSLFLLTVIMNCLITIHVGTLHASQSLYRINNNESQFYENYHLLNVIGKGTYSTVFLAKDNRGELAAVKKYAITDEKIIDLLRQNGISVDVYINQLAQKELQIGQLTDHPNIVKVREVFFENSTAYVVMDYVEGKPFDSFEEYSLEVRIIFMQQFLSALEHFLLRNIIIDDLWAENILISTNGTHLTLVDLGGNEIINNDANQPLGHYLEMIEHMLESLGGDESAKVLDNCKHFIPAALKEEIIAPAHVRILISWIQALQKKLFSPLNAFSEAT